MASRSQSVGSRGLTSRLALRVPSYTLTFTLVGTPLEFQLVLLQPPVRCFLKLDLLPL